MGNNWYWSATTVRQQDEGNLCCRSSSCPRSNTGEQSNTITINVITNASRQNRSYGARTEDVDLTTPWLTDLQVFYLFQFPISLYLLKNFLLLFDFKGQCDPEGAAPRVGPCCSPKGENRETLNQKSLKILPRFLRQHKEPLQVRHLH